MNSVVEFLFSPVFRSGPVGAVFILIALLDAWLYFRVTTEAGQVLCLASLAVRLVFLVGCIWFIAGPVFAMTAYQETAQQQGGWNSFGYLMGLIGRADDILRIYFDLVLATFCMWLFVTALMRAMRALFSWHASRLMPESTSPLTIRDASSLVSLLVLSGVLCGMRVALRLLSTE